ncbi:MAG: TIGR02117 family protein [Saprospiraceae bacterium]|nr:TIGR02117 family protein [Saprospiraceae bacterium]
MALNKAIRISLKVVAALVGLVLFYLLCAFVLSRVPVKGASQGNDVTIYLMTNGVHTDFVVPVRNEIMDWTTKVQFEHTRSNDSTQTYLGMGWGDKGFYLETPTWAELKPSVAFKAATGLNTTAIHATFHSTIQLGESCRQINISSEQYKKLVAYITSSFQTDQNGRSIHIQTDANYGDTDAFYEAIGSYSMIHTCNQWVNDGLNEAGLKSSVWTPFDTGLFLMYPLSTN